MEPADHPPPSTPPHPPSLPPPPPPPSKTYKLTASSISFTKPPSITTSLFKHYYYYSSSSSSSCTSSTLSAPTYILKDVSFTAHPSEILAVVGPSGAGKSTLLDILAARTHPTSGSLHLNSTTSILQNPSSYRKLCAYVPQHDSSTLLSLLTVSETFAFSARLLLPTTPHAARAQLTSSLLDDLGLAHLAHTRLVAQHGLSGGERRRVSIGLSLLHDPGVLILDEPTSGLDSGSAFNVMQTLKEIAGARRRTVVVSVHQPSFKILGMVDRLLLLAKGRVVHHGSLDSLEEWLGLKGFEVPPQLNALEYAMEILGQLDRQDCTPDLPPAGLSSLGELKTTDLCHDRHDEAASDDDDCRSTTDDVDSHGHLDAQKTDITVRHRSSRLHEIITLHSRYWKIVYRTRQLLLTNALEALGVGLVLGTVYINIGYDKQSIQKRLGLFAFTLTFLLSSTTETLPIFIDERPVLLREASSGVYRLSSYLVANTLVFLPYLLAISLLYSLSIYFLVGLCPTWQAFAYFTLVIWIIVLMANSFVMLLSSIAPNYIAGTSLVTVLLAGFFLFSGYFVSKDSLPKYWLFMHFFSMYKYALNALLINEYSCLVSRCFVWYGESGAGCMVTGRDVMEKRGLHERQRWTNVYALLGFFVMYRLLCLAVLMKRVSSRSNK